jgi:hypothetical protein
MKKITLILLTAFISLQLMASIGGGSNKIYEQLKSQNDCFSLSLSKEMIDAFDIDLDLNGKEKWVTGDFKEGRFLVINDYKNGSNVKKMFQKEGYELINLDDANVESDNEIYLLVSRNGKKVSEAHFIVTNDDNTVLLSIYGDMKVEKK